LKFAVIRRCRARTTRKSLPLSHSPRLAPHHALPRPRTLSPAYCVALAHTRTIVSTRSSLVAPDIAGAALPPRPHAHHSTPHAHHPHQTHKKTSARVRRMPLYYVTSMLTNNAH